MSNPTFNVDSLNLSKEEKAYIVALISKRFTVPSFLGKKNVTVQLTTAGAAQFVLSCRAKGMLDVNCDATTDRVALMTQNFCGRSDEFFKIK